MSVCVKAVRHACSDLQDRGPGVHFHGVEEFLRERGPGFNFGETERGPGRHFPTWNLLFSVKKLCLTN